MFSKKSIISLLLLFSLAISSAGSITPAYATNLEDDYTGEEAAFEEEYNDEDVTEDVTYLEEETEEEPLNENPEGMENEDSEFINPTSEVANTAADPVWAFVERLYVLVLRRPYSDVEVQHGTNELKSHAISGATLAYSFFFGPEFISYNVPNDEFVEILYEAIMGRTPSNAERNHQLRALWLGWSREDLFTTFVNGPEFLILCNRAGIDRGWHPTPPGLGSRVFATRLYRTALDRPPSTAEVQHWASALDSGTITGAAAAYAFLFGPEMTALRLPNAEFIERLYEAVMGRPSDAPGKEGWLVHLENGLPRENVFAGFVHSPEFTQICAEYGIEQGTYTPPPFAGGPQIFVTRLYEGALGRKPNQTELDTLIGQLVSDRATGAAIAHSVIFSDEAMVHYGANDEVYIKTLYRALFSRDPGQIELEAFLLQLSEGASRLSVFLSLIYTPEFAAAYKGFDIRGLTSDFYPHPGVRPFNHFGSRVGCVGVVNEGLRHIGWHPRPNRFTMYAGMNADWCAMFTNYVFDYAGSCALHTDAQHQNAKIRSWTCTTIMNTGRAQGRWADGNYRNPAPGDWILFNWGRPWSTAQHIGIVTGHDGERVFYVDGNTGGSGANMVLHQSRLLTDSTIRGYVVMFP